MIGSVFPGCECFQLYIRLVFDEDSVFIHKLVVSVRFAYFHLSIVWHFIYCVIDWDEWYFLSDIDADISPFNNDRDLQQSSAIQYFNSDGFNVHCAWE